MKRSFRTFIAMTLGISLLGGCGSEGAPQPLEMTEFDTGSQSQSGSGQGDQGQITLTLGTYDTPWELTYAVEAYNAQNGKYVVEIVDYLQEDYDYDAAKDRFKMNLATGKGTDIIWMCDMVADELGYAGVLADLNTYLTPENKENYFTNILECAQTGDKLYEIAAIFTVGFIAGNPSKLGEETGWTIDEMLETFRRNNTDANGLGGVGIYTAQTLVLHAIEDFVDWDAGKVDFCNQEFYDILEFGKNENGWVKVTQQSVTSGTHLAVQYGISEVTDIQYMNWLFGNDWVVKGWPCNQGTGVTVNFLNSLAISSYSQCPEGAWDFIEYYMTLSWLEDYAALHPDISAKTFFSIHGLPVNRQAFEKVMDWSMVQQYYDETGEPIPHYFGEGSEPNFYASSAEDVEKVRRIIALVDGRSLSSQSSIFQIIGEEISGYNSGALTAKQTAEKIQNRVQLYLDEQK